MKKNGFTLVELLAVIVILAMILAIAIPSISTLMSNASKSALESSAKLVLKGIDYKLMEDSTLNPTSITELNIESVLNIDDSNYDTVDISILAGKPYIIIVGKNKWDGLVVYGRYNDVNVTEGSNYQTVVDQLGYNSVKGVNEPVLATGMTPVKWSETAWVDTTDSDTDWYNYDSSVKRWANARTEDGSMWVWIPRYIYKISTNWHVNTAGTIDVQFSKGIDDDWNSSVIGDIDTGVTSNASNNKWTNHPAFTFTGELTGFWVAKFEASGTTSAIDSKPNVASLRNQSIGAFFTSARNMETNSRYGWGITGSGIDTHLMKNTEWGAVAYLSKSIRGKNTEVWLNNSQTFTTGCAGGSSSASGYNGCQYAYDTANGLQASTTGNIYGIYDMSGGSSEYVAAYINNANANLNNGSSIIGAAAQYKDIYTVGTPDDQPTNYGLAIGLKGDAVYETSNSYSMAKSWLGNYSYMTYSSFAWFIRGGKWNETSSAGIFNFTFATGAMDSEYSFRPVLLVCTGL